MAQPRAFGLNKIDISQAAGNANNNAESQSNAGAYALPVQLIELQEDLDQTLIIPDQANHAYTVVDTGAFNITTNNEPCINWQNDTVGQQLILRGSGLLSTGGTITETQTINATGSVANAGGVTGLTITRDAGTTNFEGVPSNSVGGFGRPCFSLTITADMVWIVDPGLGTPDADGGRATARGTLTVTGSNPFTRDIGCEDNTGNGGGCAVIGTRFRGPAYTNQTGWFAGGRFHLAGNAQEIARMPQLATGDVVTVCNRNTNQSAGISAFGATSVTRYNFTATNNSTQTVSINGVALAPGTSAVVGNNTTNASITFSVTRPARLDYDYTFAGTNSQTVTNADGAQGIDLRRQRIDIPGANNSGSASVTNTGGINVTQTSTTNNTGALGGSTVHARDNNNVNNNDPTLSYTITAADSTILMAAGRGNDDSAVSMQGTVNGVAFNISNGGTGTSVIRGFRGPAYQTGDGGAYYNNRETLQAGDVITITRTSGAESPQGVSISSQRRASATAYSTTYTNNNPYAVTLNSGTTGISADTVLAANGGSTTGTAQSSTAWTVASAFINDTGTGAGYAGGFSVAVTAGGTFNGPVGSNVDLGNPYTVQAGDAFLTLGGFHEGDSQNSFNRVGVSINGVETVYTSQGSGSFAGLTARGPAWVNGDSYPGINAFNVAQLPQVAAGDVINVRPITYRNITNRARRRAVFNQTRYGITFTNNNNSSVTISAASTGGARTIASGATATVQTGDNTNQNWIIALSSTTQYDYFVDNHGPAVATFTVNGTEVSVPVTGEDTEVQLLDNVATATQAFTWSTPAINANGDPLSPGSQAIIGPNIQRTANGTVIAGVDFTDFTGQYSRTA